MSAWVTAQQMWSNLPNKKTRNVIYRIRAQNWKTRSELTILRNKFVVLTVVGMQFETERRHFDKCIVMFYYVRACLRGFLRSGCGFRAQIIF